MKKLLILLVFVCLCEFIVADKGKTSLRQAKRQCQLKVEQSWKMKFTKKVDNWFGLLEREVQLAKECDNCHLIRAANSKTVATAEDKKVGCHCGRKPNVIDVYQCACCFQVSRWNVLICTAAGFFLHNTTLFVAVTVAGFSIINFKYQIKPDFLKYLLKALECVPLPPPLTWLAGCLTPTIDSPSPATNNAWQFCGSLEIALFQVPVLTVYTKCFRFGGDSVSLIQGKMVNASVAATAVVMDESSYNAMVCLSNAEKEKALKRRNGLLADEVVEQTGRTNWRESNPSDIPPYLIVLHQRGAVPVKELMNSGIANDFPLINDMLKRVEEENWMTKSGRMLEQPTQSCGGALLTSNKVLTICACVRSFYVVNKLAEKPHSDFFPFDIIAFDIFMEIPGVIRTGAEIYRLDKDPKKFMTESLCAKRIKTKDPWGLRALMMVMAFLPEITDPTPGRFVQWPPRMVTPHEEVDMIAFGMEKRNLSWSFRDSLGEIDFGKRAVNFHFKQCPLTNYASNELLQGRTLSDAPFDFSKRVSGFCSRTVMSELCHGKIGYPLVARGELKGLAALPVDCDDEGSIAGAIFDPVTVKEIETYIAPGKNPQTPEPPELSGCVSHIESSIRQIMSLGLVVVAVIHRQQN